MSVKNVYYDRKKNKIHLWEQISGENFYDIIDWVPYVFLHDKSASKYSSPEGLPVTTRKFINHYKYNEFCKKNKDNIYLYENDVKPEIQFLVDRYHSVPDEDLEIQNLKIYCLDIETYIDEGFPSSEKADGEVVLITIINHSTRNKVTFGIKPHNPQRTEHTFYYYPDEKDLLRAFFEFIQKRPPDVITGWNVYNYDLLYLINRSIKLFGDKGPHHLMSPLKEVSKWSGKSRVAIDIPGISILDYLSLYKRFSKPKESYRLDFIANEELGKGKRDFSHKTQDIRELYKKHWDLFVDYNVIDTKRVSELEDKLGFISQVYQMSLFTRCPVKFYESQTALIEGSMLTYFRRNNMCAPRFKYGDKESVEGAIVKEPRIGKHNWVVDLDVTSEYPTAISILNMSIDTIVGKIEDLSEQEIIEFMRKREFPEFTFKKNNIKTEMSGKELKEFNGALKEGKFSVSPIGVVFTNLRKGHMANMVKEFFRKRLELKDRIFLLQKKKVDKREINKLKSLENSIKVMINAVYGAAGAPWSRYFNEDFQGSVTACGRHIIRTGEEFVNELLNNPKLSPDLMRILKEIHNK